MTHNQPESTSLLTELGGPAVVDALIGALYFNLLNDTRIAHFFSDAPMDRILYHQRHFFTVALGGTRDYNGRTLGSAHAALIQEQGLNESHFDALINVLEQTLADFGIGVGLRQRISAVVEQTRSEIFAASKD